MARASDIVVVGSINRDLRLVVPRLPRPGETLSCLHSSVASGGKGANQAVAAAAAGAVTVLVARVGADPTGEAERRGLAAAGVDVDAVVPTPGTETGTAVLLVTGTGENSIVVAPGANQALSPGDLGWAFSGNPRVLLTQLEIPTIVVRAAAEMARERGVRFVLNAAPVTDLPPEVWRQADPLIVNEQEAAQLVGSPAAPMHLCRQLRALTGAPSVVLTTGPNGAIYQDGADPIARPAVSTTVIDTVGAGDAFTGTLAGQLALGRLLPQAVNAALHAAAAAVAQPGAWRPERR